MSHQAGPNETMLFIKNVLSERSAGVETTLGRPLRKMPLADPVDNLSNLEKDYYKGLGGGRRVYVLGDKDFKTAFRTHDPWADARLDCEGGRPGGGDRRRLVLVPLPSGS